jgi:hypothetical protein
MKPLKEAAQMPGPGTYFNDNMSDKSNLSHTRNLKPSTPTKSQKIIKETSIIPGPADYFKPDRKKLFSKKLYGEKK